MEKRFHLSERGFRRQIMSEIKKKQSLKKQLQSANEKIYEFEITLKVFFYRKTLTYKLI